MVSSLKFSLVEIFTNTEIVNKQKQKQMKKIVINNTTFPYDKGCRLLKLKYEDCPFPELEDIWKDITPMTFKEIAQEFRNIEQRRVALGCLGLERLVKEIKPKLVDTQTLKKKTTWVNQSGELVEVKFKDTYELYRVGADVWSEGIKDSRANPVYYVKFKDTSTDREYMIWVDALDVFRTNDTRGNKWYSGGEDYGKQINSIQAIAWTIQTNIEEGGIEKIVRQGDCILIKKKPRAVSSVTRHLTAEEYKKLLVLES